MDKTLQEQREEILKEQAVAKETLMQEILDRVSEEFDLSRKEKRGKKHVTIK